MFTKQYNVPSLKLLLTCEHGGNEIPEQFKFLFEDGKQALNSHRGYDLGALDLYTELEELSESSKFSTISRLLIELNRSIGHPALFSEFTKHQSLLEKEQIISKFYLPYRNAVEQQIMKLTDRGEAVLHLSVHSFTPELHGEKRNADVGLLYDPSRRSEKEFCKSFKKELKTLDSNLNIRFNYPYLGTADGFTTYLRRKFEYNYIGVEIEINQKFSSNNQMDTTIKKILYQALLNIIK